MDIDRWDVLSVIGVGLIVAGIWKWFGLPVALVVAGLFVLGIGISGARSGPAPAEDETGG